jgi:hypothetical protein
MIIAVVNVAVAVDVGIAIVLPVSASFCSEDEILRIRLSR